jgi:hypothetical protein
VIAGQHFRADEIKIHVAQSGVILTMANHHKWEAVFTWMSSGFKRDSAGEVYARARELRTHNILAGVLHLDCYWQRFDYWSDNQWDLEMFPDPSAMQPGLGVVGYELAAKSGRQQVCHVASWDCSGSFRVILGGIRERMERDREQP